MTDCEIRLYEERDFDATWQLFHRLTEHYAIGEISTHEQTRQHVATNILGRDSDVRLALGFERGVAVGLATFSIMYPVPGRKAQLYMKELFVDASHRGKGIGLSLMRFLANFALDHDCSRLDWTTERSNPDAMAFYQAIGVSPMKEKAYYRISDDALSNFAKRT